MREGAAGVMRWKITINAHFISRAPINRVFRKFAKDAFQIPSLSP